jgi:transcriptional regulator with XRE-family HTH domain
VGYLLTGDAMPGPSPTVRRRQLGMELRRLREAAGKNQEDAGRWLGIPSTAISKMETGKQRVTSAYLKLLLQLYAVGSPHSDGLEKLRSESSQRGWWAAYGETVPTWFADYVGMETAAAEVWTYEGEFIPGLLQTPDYARAVTEAMNPARPVAQIERFVEVRAARQLRLTSDDPLTLRVVINEAALRREVGGRNVMHAQTQRIIDLAQLPNVTIQVLPFGVGAHPAMLGAFTALRFPEEPMNTVYVEIDSAALYLESPAEVARYTSTFEQLTAIGLDEKASVDLLNTI